MSKIGRPKSDNSKQFAYTIRMDEQTYRRLEVYCQKMGLLKSQVIRDAIDSITMQELMHEEKRFDGRHNESC